MKVLFYNLMFLEGLGDLLIDVFLSIVGLFVAFAVGISILIWLIGKLAYKIDELRTRTYTYTVGSQTSHNMSKYKLDKKRYSEDRIIYNLEHCKENYDYHFRSWDTFTYSIDSVSDGTYYIITVHCKPDVKNKLEKVIDDIKKQI